MCLLILLQLYFSFNCAVVELPERLRTTPRAHVGCFGGYAHFLCGEGRVCVVARLRASKAFRGEEIRACLGPLVSVVVRVFFTLFCHRPDFRLFRACLTTCVLSTSPRRWAAHTEVFWLSAVVRSAGPICAMQEEPHRRSAEVGSW